MTRINLWCDYCDLDGTRAVTIDLRPIGAPHDWLAVDLLPIDPCTGRATILLAPPDDDDDDDPPA